MRVKHAEVKKKKMKKKKEKGSPTEALENVKILNYEFTGLQLMVHLVVLQALWVIKGEMRTGYIGMGEGGGGGVESEMKGPED